jgi:TetR/AcrR family transcriptional regulator, transcriptional repressor for nem operon
MAAVHGATLSARAYGDAKVFTLITDPLLDGLAARA